MKILNSNAFHSPNEVKVGCLVGQALFGDGAAIIGSDPDTLIEKPILQLVSAAQVTILDSVQAIEDHVGEMELSIHLSEDAHKLITINVHAEPLTFMRLYKKFLPQLVVVQVIGTRYFGLYMQEGEQFLTR